MSKKVTTGLVQVKVDSDKINTFFNRLDLNNNERKKAIKAALRKSVLIIRKQAQTNLVNKIPATKTKGVGRNGESYKPLKNEINIAVYKNASGARVDMIDKRKKGSRAFLLRFFNQGAAGRATKKGYNRGSIEANFFFQDAVIAKKTEAEKSLEQNIIDMIQKAASKK
jgi:hypothetical protein|nr:MAG TPA: hypothetical protein [Caudoviricetes sp.]